MDYKKGDRVGICGDCMAEFEIVRVTRDVEGKRSGYEVRCLLVHHPKPEESELRVGTNYFVPSGRIVCKLGDGKKLKQKKRKI